MSPKVSIVIPCYNASRWVAATIESALAQTWRNVEIIVVDDGSADDSLRVARQYESRGVIVLASPNRGAAAARNLGLRTASGEWIQYLDADDLLAPDKLERQLECVRQKAVQLSSSAWGRFEDDPHAARFVPTGNWRDVTGVEFLQLHWEDGGMMQPAAWLADRKLLDDVGPWDETLSLNDDGEYFARVMLRAQRIGFCAEARTFYRSNLSASLSQRRDRRALVSLFRSVELATGYLAATDASPRSRAAIAYGWKWTAFELYPGAPDLARKAERRSREFGGSDRPMPAGRKFQYLARVFGWRIAKRLAAAL